MRSHTAVQMTNVEAAKSGSMTMVMGDEPTAVGTGHIASVGLHEAIVELKRWFGTEAFSTTRGATGKCHQAGSKVPNAVENTVRTTSKTYKSMH